MAIHEIPGGGMGDRGWSCHEDKEEAPCDSRECTESVRAVGLGACCTTRFAEVKIDPGRASPDMDNKRP